MSEDNGKQRRRKGIQFLKDQIWLLMQQMNI